jgi:hypothetical protein
VLRRMRPERATCEQWTRANLRGANTVTGWSRFADISRTSAGTGNTSQSRTARRMGQIAAMKYWEIIADKLSKAG